MSSTSWKTYGGIYKTHKINNLGVGTIVTDRIIVRKQNLAVQVIEDNVILEGYQDTRGNVLATQNMVAIDSFYSGNSVFVDNRILFINNLVADTTDEEGNPIFSDAAIPVLDTVSKYQTTYNYIGGNTTSIGIGTDAPRKFLEVYENDDIVQPSQQNTETTMFSVRSHRNVTNSVLVSNNDRLYSAGVKARAFANQASLEFHASDISSNGNSIATLQNVGSDFKMNTNLSNGNIYIDSATIHLQSDGTTKMDISNNVLIYKKLVISNTDVSNSFLNEYYVDASTNYQTTDGIVLHASDASANIFQHFVNSNNKGLSIGGGGFIEDNTLSTGTLGLITNNNSSSDSSFVPIMTICEGTESNIKNRTTLGINTYSPNTNNYTLDINGKTHVGHGEIHVRARTEFVVSSMSFSKDNQNFGMVVGKSLTNSDTSYNAFVTEDGGDNWTMKEVVGDGTINGQNDNILTVFVSGISNAYISVYRPQSDANDLILYSTNKGDTWTRIQNTFTFRYRNIFGYFDTRHNIFVSSPNDEYTLYYFTVANNGDGFSTNISFSTNHFVEDITGVGNTIYSTGGHRTNSSGVIGKYVFDAFSGGVATYEQSFNGPTSFNRIYAYDASNVVAVGNDYIAYTNNGGDTDGSGWNLISNTGYNLHDVHLLTSGYGIALASDVILYSNDSYATWNPLPNRLLNSFGMKKLLMNNLNANSRLSMSLNSTLIVSHVIQNTSSEIVHNYLPTLFDSNERIMDISGSLFVEGKLICGGLQLTGTNTDGEAGEGAVAFDTVTVSTLNANTANTDTVEATTVNTDTINSGQTIQF